MKVALALSLAILSLPLVPDSRVQLNPMCPNRRPLPRLMTTSTSFNYEEGVQRVRPIEQ